MLTVPLAAVSCDLTGFSSARAAALGFQATRAGGESEERDFE